jgi:hypothetical protein
MPTFRHGKTTRLFFDQYDLSSMFRSAGVAVPVDVAETSAFGTQAKTYVTGMKGGTISSEGMFSGGAGEVDVVLAGILGAEAKSNLIVAQDGGATLGRRCWMGQVTGTNYQVSSPVSDIVSVTADFQVDSGVDFGYLLHGATQETATVNSTSVDWGAASTTSVGGALFMCMYANNRDAGSAIVKLMDSADNSAFADVTGGAFSSVGFGALSTQRIQLLTSTSVRRYTRSTITVTGGTTGGYTFIFGFAKRF